MDWEAILRPRASSFCASVRSWLKEDLIILEDREAFYPPNMPSMEEGVGRTFRSMLTALNEAVEMGVCV